MANFTTPQFTTTVSDEVEGGKTISLTWPVLTSVVDKEFNTDLAAGPNTISFGLSTADSAARMVILIPPAGNVQTITLVSSGVPLSPTSPTVLSLNPASAVTSIVLVAGGIVNGLRVIIL